MKNKHFNIPVFIPEAACPFQCIYCNQRKISGRLHIPDDDEIIGIIEERLATIDPGNSEVELAYFGGNFTGFSLEEQKHYLELIQPYIRNGLITGIRLSTRPDYISDKILDLLKIYHVKTIELGAQSLDDDVLKASKRGHTAADTEKASQIILEKGFNLGLQMMIGLPDDTLEKSVYTAHRIIEMGATETRIYPTLVIRETLLEKHYQEGKYQPLSLDEAVNWSVQLLKIFEGGHLKILKLGLHPSEGLLSGKDLVAGPWHPSFRELVLTEIWREKLEPLMHESGDSILIEVPPDQINCAVGYEGKNKKMLMRSFKVVKFRINSDLEGREYKVI
ncbi:MAG: radical SAM protein [Bacteroidales bacterium]|nr:radical SAM protein [Bacteroidales bacterium]